MSFAPQRDWNFYRSVSSRDDAFRERSPEERLEIYADFFDTIAEARGCQPRSRTSDPRGSAEKLAIRRKSVVAFLVLDKWNCETDAEDRSS